MSADVVLEGEGIWPPAWWAGAAEGGVVSFFVEGDYAPFGAVPQPVRQARAKDVSYHGHWSADFSGTNSLVTDFRYEG